MRIFAFCLVLLLAACARSTATKVADFCEQNGYPKGSDLFLQCFDTVSSAAAKNDAVSASNSQTLGGVGLGLMQMGQPRTLDSPGTTCVRQGAFLHCY